MSDLKMDKRVVIDAYYRFDTIRYRMTDYSEEIKALKNEIRMQQLVQDVIQAITIIEKNINITIRDALLLGRTLDGILILYSECEKRICDRYYEL